ncbi:MULTISPECIES: hypothetical protein [unclassified Pseudoxanthomonas]|uniref:hypothetical protein n=1 Tax=unclassified Pseudoxanthomonas TaxID=2645906 RepID=UPI0008E880EF|nr:MULTISPECIES: hypothetical protein [unclassified Pseudoxanthomonas]SFV32061.1 hypothetical protein SAMN05428990_2297 [Pseudoxanthomonas sp. YR558]
MKSMSLVAVALATALSAASAHAAGNTAPVLELPGTLTSSGKTFLAKCDDRAFAEAADPRHRAERCARLLAQWRVEAAGRSQQPSAGKVQFGAPRGIAIYPPPPNAAAR